MQTSYFAKNGKHPNTVSITSYCPQWFNGKHYHNLSPPWSIVSMYKKGLIDTDKYEELYVDQVLSKLDARIVLSELGQDAILLCYEKSGEFCHRHIVADWLKAQLDIIVEEV